MSQRRWGAAVMRDAAAIPLILVGMFMMVMTTGTRHDELVLLEDKLFGGVGGDYKEETFGVHGAAGVYPVRLKYYDNPRYNGPPVVLVHGMGTSDAYLWRVRGQVDLFPGFIYSERRDIDAVGHAQGLVDLGYDVVTYTYPDSRNRPIEYQAYDLVRVVHWTKEKFVKREVILVGHSLGGLVCRYYVEAGQPDRANYIFPAKEKRSYNWNRYYNVSDYYIKKLKYNYDVAALVLLATPNLGSLKEEGLDRDSPALFELKENSDFVKWLEEGRRNAAAKGYKRPPTAVFVGTAYEDYMAEGPLDFGDGMVSVASAEGNWRDDPSAAGRVYRYDLDHFELAMDGEVLARIYNFLHEVGL